MKKKISSLILFIIFIVYLTYNWGFKSGEASKQIEDWYPRLSWKEYLKEQGYEGAEITDIYIKDHCLMVGINNGVKEFPHILTIK